MKHVKIYEDFVNESKVTITKLNPTTFRLEVDSKFGQTTLTAGSEKEAGEMKSKIEKAFKDGKINAIGGIGAAVYEATKLDLQNDIFDSGKGGYKDWKFDPAGKKLTVTYDIGKWDDKGRYAKEIKWLATNDRSSIGSGNQLVGHLDLYLEPHGLEVDKRRAHKYDPNTGKVELNLTDYNPGGNSYGHSVWEKESAKDKVQDLVQNMSAKKYKDFAFDNDIDHRDAMEMQDFLSSLSDAEAEAILKKYGKYNESSEALSESTFSVEDGIKVQSEQLAQWKKLLQPKVYKDLEKWATEHNDKAESGNQIIRGTDMDNFIGNYFNSYTPSNKR